MCKEKFIDPFTDFGFKRLFGSEKAKTYLVSLLNSILEDEDPIVDIKYENVEKLGMLAGDRSAIFDIYCTTDKGSHIIVEMQNAKQSFFMDRSIYYSSFLVQDSARKGDWNFELPKIYTVGFLNFEPKEFDKSDSYKHVVRLCDVNENHPVSDKLTYIYLEMKKFVKDAKELDGISDEWMYVIKHLPHFMNVPPEVKDKVFTSFFNLAKVSAMSRQEKISYEESLKSMRDFQNCIDTAQGEGLEQGIEIGKEIGARQRAVEIARRLKEIGIPAESIAAASGLSIGEIEAL